MSRSRTQAGVLGGCGRECACLRACASPRVGCMFCLSFVCVWASASLCACASSVRLWQCVFLLCPGLLYLLVSIRLSLSSYGCLFMQRLECLWFALAIPADDFTAGLRWQPEDRLGYAICFKHLMITY